uniref:Autophagy-related protein 101 n=1 Tax=Heterorhabditis bacteriophora TaxID=37862 RepID=A0A1I7XE10_HETBA
MNARQQEFRLSLELRQVNDAVSCIFHSLMTHRSVAKFDYKGESNYSLGCLGIKEVECDTIDLTYVRINSDELACHLAEEVQAFRDDIEQATRSTPRRTPLSSPSPTESAIPLLCAQISLEFYQKRRRQWPLADDSVSWEKWMLCLDIFKVNSYDDLARMRVSVAESVGEIVLSLCSAINRQQYLPKMPVRAELNNVFDSHFSDCQPYLFKVTRMPTTTSAVQQSGFSTVRRLIKDFTL